MKRLLGKDDMSLKHYCAIPLSDTLSVNNIQKNTLHNARKNESLKVRLISKARYENNVLNAFNWLKAVSTDAVSST